MQLIPSKSRYVEIRHPEWGSVWQFQIPESIACVEGWILDFPELEVDWTTGGAQTTEVWADPPSWSYTWCGDSEYAEAQDHRQKTQGAESYVKPFIAGIRLDVRLWSTSDAVAVSLAITNESGRELTDVSCDGGCLQARSREFTGPNEADRTHLIGETSTVSMSSVPRTHGVRCMYVTDPSAYDRPPLDEGEWFWGRSSFTPEYPVTVGMQNDSADRWVVFRYTHAAAGSANSDDHHCIHSRPSFGSLAHGATAERRGAIVFAPSVDSAVSRLNEVLGGASS